MSSAFCSVTLGMCHYRANRLGLSLSQINCLDMKSQTDILSFFSHLPALDKVVSIDELGYLVPHVLPRI